MDFGVKFWFLGRICFEMGAHGSDLAQNLTQLLQIGFPTRFEASRGLKTLILEFLKSCNFLENSGGAQGIPNKLAQTSDVVDFSQLGLLEISPPSS